MTADSSPRTNETSLDEQVRAGLRAYSRGDVDTARSLWDAVLEHAPNHKAARDYRTHTVIAPEQHDPIAQIPDAREVLTQHRPVLSDAQDLHSTVVSVMKSGRLEEALVLLEYGRTHFEGGRRRFTRVSEMVRHLLTLRYVAYLGPLEQDVHAGKRAKADALTAEEMHVLALVDVSAAQGGMTLERLIDDSLYGPFQTLRALLTLERQSYVRLDGTEPAPADDDASPVADASDAPPSNGDASPASDAIPDWEVTDVPNAPEGEATMDDTVGETPLLEEEGEHAPEASTPSEDSAAEDSAAEAEASDPEAEEEFGTVFRRAVSAYVQGEFDEARRLFTWATELRPDDPRPRRNLDRLNALEEREGTRSKPTS